MKQIDLCILIVSYNTQHLLVELFEALDLASDNLVKQLVVVDNASTDASVEWFKFYKPDSQVIVNTKNVGFGRANNQALDHICAPYVLLLNTDAFVSPNSLTETIRYMNEHPRCGILGTKLVGRDGNLQPSCRYFPTPWNLFLQRSGLTRFFPKTQMIDDMTWDHASERACDWVPGCFYLVRREVIVQVGLFDPRYFLYYEEVDHCFAAKKAGWEVHYFPYTSVIHLGGESAKSDGSLTESGRQLNALQIESELLYFRKNHGLFGLATHSLLCTSANIINLVKDVLKIKPSIRCSQHIKHTVLFWTLFFRTHAGFKPTR